MPATAPPLLYTPAEAARVLSIGRSKLYDLIDSGEIPSLKVGRCRRIQHSALVEYVARLAAPAA